MEQQTSMFSETTMFPKTYEDMQQLYEAYIYEGETDEDVFTYKELKTGRSYFFYGKKVFEFVPDSGKGSKIKKATVFKEIGTDEDGDPISIIKTKMVPISQDELMAFLEEMKQLKRVTFRGVITESFACCNDFKKCSAVGYCIHQKDRFYNGCYYRTNLEAGRNFYRENKE